MALRDQVNPILDAADALRVVLEAQVGELTIERDRLRADAARLQLLVDASRNLAAPVQAAAPPRPLFGAWLQRPSTSPFPAMRVQRFFDGGVVANYADSKAATADALIDLCVYSHKPGLGVTETGLELFYRSFPRDREFALIVQHEPENNAYTSDQRQQWRDLQVRHAAVVGRLAADGYKMSAWQCLMGWTFDPDNRDRVRDVARWFVPGIGLAIDAYPHADRQGNALAAVRDHARAMHIPWAVAEYAIDVESFSTDSGGLDRMISDVAQMRTEAYPAEFVSYFNGDGTWGTGIKHFRIDTDSPFPRPLMLHEWRGLCR